MLLEDISRKINDEIAYLASTTSCDNIPIPYRPLDNHDGIMKTSLYFRNELLRSSSQDQSTCVSCWASLEKVESLASDLSLLEPLACA